MSVGHALEHIAQVSKRLNAVELCGSKERGNDGPARRAAVRSGEQMVLATERDGANGTFHCVVVELDASVVQEASQGSPAGECVADGLGEGATRWDAVKLCLEPGLHRCDQR